MNILYLVIEKNIDDREVSNIVAVYSQYDTAYKHLINYRSFAKGGDTFEYEIIGLSLDDVDKPTGAVKYLKNKIKGELENVL